MKLPEWVKEIDLSYAAGFLDADGCLSINRAFNQTKHGQSFSPRVSGFSIDRHILEFMQSMFGGKISASLASSGRVHYRWSVNSDEALALAKILLPYLRIKREQASLIVALRDGFPWSRGNRKTITQEEFSRRSELAERSRYLNQRKYLEPHPIQ